MKRTLLFLSLLLSITPAAAAPKTYGTITTRSGKSFYDCKVVHVYPDGVGFTHQNGAAKIAFKDLPENLRGEFRYDPKAAAAYQREQASLRRDEQKRRKIEEVAMHERLMEAQTAETIYLAAARASYMAPTPHTMSLALPGETLPKVAYQTPSWVGAPITGPAIGGRDYRSGSYSRWGNSIGYGGGYSPYYRTGGYGYGYPYGSYYGGGYMQPSAYMSPTIFRSWNVGGGFQVGVGVSPFCSGIRLFP